MSKQTEALKLALEALGNSIELTPDVSLKVRCRDAITAIREALAEQPAQQQEPVAWRFTGIAGLKRYMTQTQYDAQTPETKKWYEPFLCANCTPSPQPAQQEPFALLVRKHSWNKGQYDCAPPNAPEYGRKWADERVWVYTAPPAQRKPWVGLTQEDMYEIGEFKNTHGYVPTGFKRLVAAIEAKLREKNA